MDTRKVRIRLIEKDLRIKDLANQTGIDYDRLQKILNDYRPPKPEEVQAIANTLDLVADELVGSHGEADVD